MNSVDEVHVLKNISEGSMWMMLEVWALKMTSFTAYPSIDSVN